MSRSKLALHAASLVSMLGLFACGWDSPLYAGYPGIFLALGLWALASALLIPQSVRWGGLVTNPVFVAFSMYVTALGADLLVTHSRPDTALKIQLCCALVMGALMGSKSLRSWQTVASWLLVGAVASQVAGLTKPAGASMLPAFENYSASSAGLILIMPLAASLMAAPKRLAPPLLVILSIAAFVMGAGARQGAFMGIVSCLTLAVILIPLARHPRRITVFKAVILGSALSGGLAVGNGLALNTGADTGHAAGDSLAVLWRMVRDTPPVGWGLGTFARLYPQYRDPDLVQASLPVAGQDFLELWVELGWLGCVLPAMLGIVLVCAILNHFRQDGGDSHADHSNDLALGLALLALLYKALDGGVLDSADGLFVVGFLSAPIGYRGVARVQDTWAHGGQAMMHGLALIMLIVFMGIQSANLAGFSDLVKARELPMFPPDAAMRKINAAAGFLPFHDEALALRGILATNSLLSWATSPMTGEQSAIAEHARADLDASIAMNGLRSAPYREKARLLFLQGGTREDISALLDQSLANNPYDPGTRVVYANYLHNTANDSDAAFRVAAGGLGKTYLDEVRHGLYLLEKIRQVLPPKEKSEGWNAFLDAEASKLRALKRADARQVVFSLGKPPVPGGSGQPVMDAVPVKHP